MDTNQITVAFISTNIKLITDIVNQADNGDYKIIKLPGKYAKLYQLKIDGLDIIACYGGHTPALVAGALSSILIYYKVRLIFNVGFASTLTNKLSIGDIIIAEKVKRINVNFSVFGVPDGIYPFEYDENDQFDGFETHFRIANHLSERSSEIFQKHKAFTGTIYSGEEFYASNDKKQILRNKYNEQIKAIDLDSVAVAEIAESMEIPFISAKAITDLADDNAVASFKANFKLANENMLTLIAGSIASFINIKRKTEQLGK